MGYACPVCDVPQRDAEHLANHLAFTAMLHDDGHESWLDDHVPEWSSTSADELGPAVVEFAEETEYEDVFEDTVHGHGGHGHGGHSHTGPDRGGESDFDEVPDSKGGFNASSAAAAGGETLDEEAQSVLQEARELTAQMRDERAEGNANEGRTDADAEEGGDADDGDE